MKGGWSPSLIGQVRVGGRLSLAQCKRKPESGNGEREHGRLIDRDGGAQTIADFAVRERGAMVGPAGMVVRGVVDWLMSVVMSVMFARM